MGAKSEIPVCPGIDRHADPDAFVISAIAHSIAILITILTCRKR
jgi:hypothetical protein